MMAVFDPVHEFPDADALASNIHQRVSHDLARSVIGHLAAAVHLDHRDVTRRKHVLCLAGLALGENRRMLNQPQFVAAVFIARVGKRLHSPPDRFVLGQSETPH